MSDSYTGGKHAQLQIAKVAEILSEYQPVTICANPDQVHSSRLPHRIPQASDVNTVTPDAHLLASIHHKIFKAPSRDDASDMLTCHSINSSAVAC